jgi:hypothetical protein
MADSRLRRRIWRVLEPHEDLRVIGPYTPQRCAACGVRNDDGGDWQGEDFLSCNDCGGTFCPIHETGGRHQCVAPRALQTSAKSIFGESR